jgi:hypothetical protein
MAQSMAHPFTAQSMAQLFIDNIFKLHSLPVAILTDRDRIFTSKFWQDLFKSLKVTLQYTSAYHPQTDGPTERVNQCLENYLRCMSFIEPKKWSSWLPLTEWWYNTNYHTSLQCTPFQALYGYPPSLISEMMIPRPDSPGLSSSETNNDQEAKRKSGTSSSQDKKSMQIKEDQRGNLQLVRWCF